MNFNHWICALLLFFCVGINSLNFPGSVDGRIRKCLIAGLKRFHTNSVPLVRNIPILYDSENSSMLSSYPDELQQVVLENLDFKSIKKLSQCNKKTALLSASTIAQRLASFNPHFVFDDELVNSLLLAVLDKHFPKSKNLQSETIHDELQLLIMKYVRKLNFDSIPKNIYFYLISFINEAVNGVDATFDISTQYFCILLLKFKIPESYKYYMRFFANSVFKYPENSPYVEHLNFFSLNPSKEEVRRFFEIPADINDWVKPGEMHYGFYNAILELFYDEFTNENVVKLYDACHMKCYVSLRAFTRRYFSIIDEAALMRAYNAYSDVNIYSNANRAIICNELSVRFGKTIDTCYFSTRNSLNELSMDRVASFDSETIIEQLKRYPDCRIYDVELVVTVINSNLITPKLRFKILKCFIYKSSYSFIMNLINDIGVMLLIKETIQPINFIEYLDNNAITQSLTDCFRGFPDSISLEFVDSINDPFICLMSLGGSRFPPEAKNIIHQKDLNLNKIYRIDLELGYELTQFVGRTMHFKQILKELNNPKLNEAFRFNSNDLNHDYSTIDESLPVIIVDEDYTFILNSH
jgi:hypothetical protein